MKNSYFGIGKLKNDLYLAYVVSEINKNPDHPNKKGQLFALGIEMYKTMLFKCTFNEQKALDKKFRKAFKKSGGMCITGNCYEGHLAHAYKSWTKSESKATKKSAKKARSGAVLRFYQEEEE